MAEVEKSVVKKKPAAKPAAKGEEKLAELEARVAALEKRPR